MPSLAVKPFDFKGTPVRTVTYETGLTWWVLSDVCKVLGLTTPARVAERLDVDEKGVSQIHTPGGDQDMTIVNESGLYNVILRSDKPEAREFKRWVTHEVLPSIRQHGGYMAGQESMSPEQMTLAAMSWLKSKVDEQAQQIAVMAPKARALDDFTDTRSSYSVNEASKLLVNAGVSIGQKSLFELMRDLKWVFRRESHWIANQDRINLGHLMMRAYQGNGTKSDGSRFDFAPQVRITRKGLILLHQRLTTQQFNLELEGASNA